MLYNCQVDNQRPNHHDKTGEIKRSPPVCFNIDSGNDGTYDIS
ncbi:unnamed protein product [Schistosoma curassoni]|uniref:Fibrillar collagen NC1 domain-containing protein n=1 Tax=Schistosoma curassoni TaxID=6186 RepID=A0A183JMC1_9TREM|nr:unnamed protein product [Schistosoma curassoni]